MKKASKFRDEIRPRFGLMRAREFLMKDMYSFDCSKEEAYNTYEDVKKAYEKIFNRVYKIIFNKYYYY